MKRLSILCLSLSLSTVWMRAEPAETPTMGWSSWNTYRVNISDRLIMKQADLMVELGLDTCGYRYVNIDDGYFGGRDANGRLKTHPNRFPNGLKGVVDHIHALGLKAGIYSDGGEDTCGCFWDKDVLGAGVGFYGHDDQDAAFFFREHDFDFIKVDFCGGDGPQNAKHLTLDERERYTAIRKAIDRIKPGVRLNVCRWNYPGTWVREVGSSWRISGDINPTWGRVKAIIRENLYLSAYAAPGAYNDMDMLEVGRGFSDEEDQTHFAVWCLMSSPLLIGCDLESLKSKPKTLALLKNPRLIALDQDTAAPQAYVVERDGDAYVLVRDIEKPFGTARVVGFVNLGDEAKTITVPLRTLDLADVSMRNLITDEAMESPTDAITATVPAHGTRLYRLDAKRRLERVTYEGETAFLPTYQEIRDPKRVKSAHYAERREASGGWVATGLGGRPGNDLVWENVHSAGGNYQIRLYTFCDTPRAVNISVNGGTPVTATAAPFKSLNDLDRPSLFQVTLKKGVNTIRVFNDADPLPDIDAMHLTRIP